jgi:tetratricopeptide (TPR) repeat protein
MLYADQAKYAEAEPLYRQVLSIQEKTLKPDDPNLALSCIRLGAFYVKDGKYADAEVFNKRAVEIAEKAFGPDSPEAASPVNNLAITYEDLGRYPPFRRPLKASAHLE